MITVRDQLANATTRLDNTFWNGSQANAVYPGLTDSELENLIGHLIPWGGHHPPGGGSLGTRQAALETE